MEDALLILSYWQAEALRKHKALLVVRDWYVNIDGPDALSQFPADEIDKALGPEAKEV